jgi:hypothetical protein
MIEMIKYNWPVVLLIIFILFVGYVFCVGSAKIAQERVECEAKGGVLVKAYNGFSCVKGIQ